MRETASIQPGTSYRVRPYDAGAVVPAPFAAAAPIKVSALVDLLYTPHAGGHVKSWEHFAYAAVKHAGVLDLTVHFLGEQERVIPLAGHVRLCLHAPRFCTNRLPFLSHVPDHTDLAFYNPKLAKRLAACDLIHTTDAFFSFARTALKVSRRCAIPLVNSIHTDTPSYTRVYTAQTTERVFGHGLISRFLLERLKVHLRMERYMQRRLEEHQRASAYVLVSKAEEREDLRRRLPDVPVRMLRRGIDTGFFSPVKRDRAWLQKQYAPGTLVILFVGRLSRGKNVLVVAEAVARLAEEGLPVQLICAGQGTDRQAILDRLGPRVRCPGVILGEELARLYASADILAMPSEIEVFCNVVQEAMASALPIVLARGGGMGRLVGADATGVIVNERSPEAWANALRPLCLEQSRRVAMGHAGRQHAESKLPSWDDVLEADLLPVWLATAKKRTSS